MQRRCDIGNWWKSPGIDRTQADHAINREAYIEAIVELGIGREGIFDRGEGLPLITGRQFTGEARSITRIGRLNIGTHRIDAAQQRLAGNTIPLRRTRQVRSNHRRLIATGEGREWCILAIDAREPVTIAIIAVHIATVVTNAGLQGPQQTIVAECQGQVDLAGELLILGDAGIILETVHAILGDIIEISAIEGDRRDRPRIGI